jgi:hypothetical protein
MPDKETTRTLPPHWSDDSLSSFLDDAFSNCLATFVRKKPVVNILVDLDGCFQKIGENLLNPPDLIGALLLLRSHSAFRAASGLAMSGQVTETFPVLRTALEYGLYGLHISRNPDLGEIWYRRHDSEKAKNQVRQEFSIKSVKATLSHEDGELNSVVHELYDRLIDFGGHPNERAVTGNIEIQKDDGNFDVQQVYLHGDSLSLIHAIKTTAQVGLVCLELFRFVFGERYDILGISDQLDQFKKLL